MAWKKKSEKVTNTPVSPVMVRVTNKVMTRREVPLIDGSSLHLGAWHNKSTAHISEPIDQVLLSPAVLKMAKRGELSIEEV
jgi:hypothetical protein